jgi:hypothetical protein
VNIPSTSVAVCPVQGVFSSSCSEVEEKQLLESVLLKDSRSLFPEERVVILGKAARAGEALWTKLRGIRVFAPGTLKKLKAPLARRAGYVMSDVCKHGTPRHIGL